MHDFFVGLMGKRNTQPGKGVAGLGAWPGHAAAKSLMFVLRGKDKTSLSCGGGSRALSTQSAWSRSAVLPGSPALGDLYNAVVLLQQRGWVREALLPHRPHRAWSMPLLPSCVSQGALQSQPFAVVQGEGHIQKDPP